MTALTVGQLVEQLLRFDARTPVSAVVRAGTESFAVVEVTRVDANEGTLHGVSTTLPLLALEHPRIYDLATKEPLPMAMLMVDD